jgi:sugar phosphate permease
MGRGVLRVVSKLPAANEKITTDEVQYIETNRRFNSSHHSIPWKVILKNRNLWALMLMYFCCQWAQYFFVAWMPVFLMEGRHFSENFMKQVVFILFLVGIIGFLVGGWCGDMMVKRKGLRFGRRFVGMVGLGGCGLFIFLASITLQNYYTAFCLIAANAFFSFGVMVSYAVCTDIGRNNAGTVTGAMNFFGQMGAFFLAIIFGKIVDATQSFDYPLYVLASVLLTGCLLWLAVDPLKQVSLKDSVSEAVV